MDWSELAALVTHEYVCANTNNKLYYVIHTHTCIINKETAMLGRCRMGRAGPHIYPYI